MKTTTSTFISLYISGLVFSSYAFENARLRPKALCFKAKPLNSETIGDLLKYNPSEDVVTAIEKSQMKRLTVADLTAVAGFEEKFASFYLNKSLIFEYIYICRVKSPTSAKRNYFHCISEWFNS